MHSSGSAAILWMIGWQRHAALVYRVLVNYLTSMPWSIDTCQNKVSTDQYHVTISGAQVYSSSRSHVFWRWLLIDCWFSIKLWAPVNLTCQKQGRIVWKLNCDPGLKVNQIITIFCRQMFLTAFVLCILWLLKLQTEGQTIYRKPHCKVTKLKAKFYLFLG